MDAFMTPTDRLVLILERDEADALRRLLEGIEELRQVVDSWDRAQKADHA